MTRARAADGAGDNVACKHALAEVQRAMALKDLSFAPRAVESLSLIADRLCEHGLRQLL